MSRYVIKEFSDNRGIKNIVVISHFAGKSVKGIAKCDPRDEYDYKEGVRIATARCDEKISDKRIKLREKKMQKAYEDLLVAQKKYNYALESYKEAKKI